MEDLFRIGVITNTHGIKGEVKVFPTTDDVKRFKKLKKCILDTGKQKLDIEIENCKFFKQFVILKFKGIDDINDVLKYKNSTLWVTRENSIKLKKNEYFVSDLIDSLVVDEDEKEIGILKDVLFTGANDVYVVKANDEKEILIPAIKQCILEVSEKKVKVHLMKGLVD